MSQLYRYEVEVWPVKVSRATPDLRRKTARVIRCLRLAAVQVDSHMTQGNRLVCFGEHAISGDTESNHADVVKELKHVGWPVKVITRWRNIENDPWDDEHGDVEDGDTTTCDECGAGIPDTAGGGLANKHHAESCSLYDGKED